MFSRKKITFTITIFVEPDDSRFHAFCPALKGLHVEGSSEEDACQNAVDAAIAYLTSLIRHGDPIPLGVMVKEEIERESLKIRPPSMCVHQIPVTV